MLILGPTKRKVTASKRDDPECKAPFKANLVITRSQVGSERVREMGVNRSSSLKIKGMQTELLNVNVKPSDQK